jgi:hypothetical protein
MRIRPIMPSAARIWTASRMVRITFIGFSLREFESAAVSGRPR